MANQRHNAIVEILMNRDGMSLADAELALFQAREELDEGGADPEEILSEFFGLEGDYMFDLLDDSGMDDSEGEDWEDEEEGEDS